MDKYVATIFLASIVAVATWGIFGHGNDDRRKWEYKSYHGVMGQVLQLDELGAEGRELVAVCPMERDGQATFYLKRKK